VLYVITGRIVSRATGGIYILLSAQAQLWGVFDYGVWNSACMVSRLAYAVRSAPPCQISSYRYNGMGRTVGLGLGPIPVYRTV